MMTAVEQPSKPLTEKMEGETEGAISVESKPDWGGVVGALGERMGAYPLVADSLTKMGEMYVGAKESSRLVKMAGEAAESGVRMVVGAARPIGETTVGPVGFVSDLSMKSLDTLEKAVPLLKEPTGEVVGAVQAKTGAVVGAVQDRARGLYDATVGARVTRVQTAAQGVKQYTNDQVMAARAFRARAVADLRTYALARAEKGEAAFNKLAERAHLDSLIDYVDGMLDYLLPVSEGNPEGPVSAGSPARPMYPRDPSRVLLAMPAKLGGRVRAKGSKNSARLAASLAAVRDNLVGLSSTLDLVALLNKGMSDTSEKVKVRVGQAKESLAAFYADSVRKTGAFQTEIGELSASASLDTRVLFTIRSLASGISERFGDLLKTPALTDSLRTRVLSAKTKAESTFQWVDKVTGVSELSSDVISKMQSNVAYMVQTYGSLIETALSSPALNWTGLNKYVPTTSEKASSGSEQPENPLNQSTGTPTFSDYDDDDDDDSDEDTEEELNESSPMNESLDASLS